MPNYNIYPERQLADMIDSGKLTFDVLKNATPPVAAAKIEKVKNILENRGRHATEATDWEKAQQENTYEGYKQFLDKHPDSSHKAEAKEQMDTIRIRDLEIEFEHVMSGIGVSLAEMETFVSKYHDMPQAEKVQQKIEQIRFQEVEDAWKACKSDSDYEQFRQQYPNSNHIAEIGAIIMQHAQVRQQQDEQAWQQARVARIISLLEDYVKNYSIHRVEAQNLISQLKSEEDERAWKDLEQNPSLSKAQDYLAHYTNHEDEARKIEHNLLEEAQREPLIIEEINSVLCDPFKDVADYLELCAKYPSKREDIKQWMLQDMKITPERYQRDEMYMLMFKDGTYLEQPLFNPQEIEMAGILDRDRITWIRNHPQKNLDDKNDVAVEETCFETEKNNTDVFFFGVPGSGKTSVLAGLLSVADLDVDSTFRYLYQGCKHKGYPYANNLTEAVSNHVFPARTRIRSISTQKSGTLSSSQPANGNINKNQPTVDGIGSTQPIGGGIGGTQPIGGGIGGTQPIGGGIGGTQPIGGGIGGTQPIGGGIGDTQPIGGGTGSDQQVGIPPFHQQGTKDDKFIQIIDATIETAKGSVNKLSIVEMPGERTLQFAAAQKHDMSMLGKGTETLFCNANRKVFFFVIDPDDSKQYSVDMFNEVEVKLTQARALTAVADFLVEMLKADKLNNLDSVHVIMSKSDTIRTHGKGMQAAIQEIMKRGEYKTLVNALKKLCNPKIGNVNAHCNHQPLLYPFSLGKILPGDMFNYDPRDSQTILKVIRANTISVGAPTAFDVLLEWANKKIF